MKRILAFLTAALALMAISSCEETGKDEPDDDKLEVLGSLINNTLYGVCKSFPIIVVDCYDRILHGVIFLQR